MNRKPQNKPVIDRYKMFKYGKHWVYAGITLASVGTTLLMTTNAQAAEQDNNSETPTAAVAAQPTTAITVANSTAAAAPATTPTVTADELNGTNQTNGDQSGVANSDALTPESTAKTSSATSQDNSAAVSASSSATTSAANSVASESSHSDAAPVSGDDQVTSTDSNATSNDQSAASATGKTEANQTSETSSAPESSVAANPTAEKSAAVSAISSSAPLSASSHGPVYTTDDTTLDHKGTITIEQTGPYAITWKEVSSTNQTETKTVTLDASDFVNLFKTISDTTGNTDKLAAAKAKYQEMLAQLKALPSKVASQVVGNLLYQMIFTGTGSQALSNFRTTLDSTRYNISNTWTGLDPVAYAADREAAETYYPAAVTWYNNATKETWTLPEYNNPTQNVRATYIQNGDSTKTVVIGQGWTERPDWIGYVSKIWYDMGYNILMPSQRGQFLSDGNDMTFGYQDKYDWLNWVRLVDERNGADSQVVFYGQSLGADTVIEAASVPGLSKSVKAVIADAGYATLPELGSTLYNKAVVAISSKLTSIGLPAITSIPFLSYDQVLAVINNRLMKQQGFSLDDISGVSAASKVTIPLMLIHTEDDAFIPYTQSLELAAANNSKIKTVWILPGQVGGHAGANNAVLQYTQHIKDFLAETTATNVDTGEAVVPEDDDLTVETPTTTVPAENGENTVKDNGTADDVTDNGNATDQNTVDTDAGNIVVKDNDANQVIDDNATTSTNGTTAVIDQSTNGDNTENNATNISSSKVTVSDDNTATSTKAPTDAVANQEITDTTVSQPVTTLDQAKPVNVDQTARDSLDPTATKTVAKATNVDLDVLTAKTESPVSATDLSTSTTTTTEPLLTAKDLVEEDQSGSVVTASLKHDVSATFNASDFTTASVMVAVAEDTDARPTQLVDHTAKTPQTATKATTLPQASEQPQSWIAALGASLIALATGLWASLRRRFNH